MSTTGTVLVTGGAGFIGSHLADRLLTEGYRVVVIDDLSTGKLVNLADARMSDPERFEFHRLDLLDSAFDAMVAKHMPEFIFHLAAQMNVRASVIDPFHDARVNVLGTLAVLEAARRHGVRKVVFTTSGGCIYGEPAEHELPVREDYPGYAYSPYGASKRCGEEYLRTYRSLYGVKWTSLALANVYGPRQDPLGEAGVVAIFAARMLAGLPVVIYGDGEQTRDFVYVDDVVQAYMLAMDRGDDERFNIGTGERTSVNALYRALAAAAGYGAELLHAPQRAGELRHNALDCSKAAQLLGWKPRTTLVEGLATMLVGQSDRSWQDVPHA